MKPTDADIIDRTARRIADKFCAPFLEELDALRSSASLPAAEIRELQAKVLQLCAERLAVAANMRCESESQGAK
jgi:hypothetical protein